MAGTPAVYHDRLDVTVLVVDDHPSFRANAQALLEAEGFEVVGEAEDGPGLLPFPRPFFSGAARPSRLAGLGCRA